MNDEPAPFEEYTVEVPNLGTCTVIDPAGEPGYRYRLPDGQVSACSAASGDPCQANAAADIAYALAHPSMPPSPVPAVVGSGQIRAAMIASGIAADDAALDALIEGALAGAIADATERAIALTLWRNASDFKRDNAFIAAAQLALGKSAAEIDDLFRLAATF
jgi:hypothetical protein